MTGCWRRDEDDVLLSVRLTPRASKDSIGGVWTDAHGQVWLSVSVTAPPDKGRANEGLVALFAKALDCPRSTISLVAGESSRLKRLRLAGAGHVVDRIDQLARL